jgi:hypothetical protein
LATPSSIISQLYLFVMVLFLAENLQESSTEQSINYVASWRAG